jgi:hypothetical protein
MRFASAWALRFLLGAWVRPHGVRRVRIVLEPSPRHSIEPSALQGGHDRYGPPES